MSPDPSPKNRKKPIPKPSDKGGSLAGYAQWSGLAFQMVAIVCAAYFLGNRIDRWANRDDALFTLAGVVAGVIASMVLAIRLVLNRNKNP